MRRTVEDYPLMRSPFRRLGRQRDLAELLGIDLKSLKKLVRNRTDYYWSKEETINGKRRKIICPFRLMRRIHEKLKFLFNRIEQPDYLYSPRHGRSDVMNAEHHIGAKVAVKLDIRQFYPSTTDEHVFRFCYHVLGMADDVAGLLTKLCTIENQLPFGSPLSPILCALVHRDLFDAIGAECQVRDLRLSVWVDDLTLSGEEITDRVLFEIKRKIVHKGLRYHKVTKQRLASGIVITGAHVSQWGVAPANKTHLKMRDKLVALDDSNSPDERITLIRSLIGLNNHMGTLYAPHDLRTDRLKRQRAWLHNERRFLERCIEADAAERLNRQSEASELPCASDSPPWA